MGYSRNLSQNGFQIVKNLVVGETNDAITEMLQVALACEVIIMLLIVYWSINFHD